MDPDECLEQIRDALHDFSRELAYKEMAEHFQALDEWLSKGGFLPEAWRR